MVLSLAQHFGATMVDNIEACRTRELSAELTVIRAYWLCLFRMTDLFDTGMIVKAVN